MALLYLYILSPSMIVKSVSILDTAANMIHTYYKLTKSEYDIYKSTYAPATA